MSSTLLEVKKILYDANIKPNITLEFEALCEVLDRRFSAINEHSRAISERTQGLQMRSSGMFTTKCDHKKTKMKLVAWAIDCKGKHEQGFKWAKCCSICGCVVAA